MSAPPHPLRESAEALYDESPCGYLSILPHGEITQVNRTLQTWIGYGADALCGGMRLQSLLTVPSALLYETHCVPLLRLRGFISEIALELKGLDGQVLSVLLSAAARRDEAGEIRLIRIVVMSAPTRRQYERELVRAREQAEETAEQLRELRALAERKVTEQAALLEAVGRMASGDLLTPVSAGDGGQLAPLSRALEHMRNDVLNTLRQMDARTAEVLQLNRELRHQIEQRSRLMIESIDAIEAAKATGSAPPDDGVVEAQPLLPPGTRISDRYRIAAILGQGGMGTVYEVERNLDGRRYAAKVLGVKPNFQAMLRFAREAQLLARLHHPNLVGIIDVDMTVDRVAFIVMELVRGPSLAELRAHYGEMPFILPILFQITEALAAVHRAGVVHRDLKPANVLIMFSEDDQPIVKLVDFGVSRLHDPGLDTPSGQAQAAREVASVALSLRGAEAASAPTLDGRETIDLSALARTEWQEPERPAQPASPMLRDTDAPTAPLRAERARPRRSSEELTLPGTMLGTPLYMAPELRGGAQLARPASDVFSFGVLSYEILTGTLPFEQPPLLWSELGITSPTFVPLARLCPDLDPALASTLEGCLQLDPALRPTTDELSETMLRTSLVHR